MADFRFYCSKIDRSSILRELLNFEIFNIYVDDRTHSSTPTVVSLGNIEDVINQGERQFFISLKADGRGIAKTTINKGPDLGKQFINFNKGPLFIAIQMPPYFLKETIVHFGPGSIYYNLKNREDPSFDDAELVKSLFSNCINIVKKHFLREYTTKNGQKLNISSDMFSFINHGGLIQVDGDWIDFQ